MQNIYLFITDHEALLLKMIGVLLFVLFVEPYIWKFVK